MPGGISLSPALTPWLPQLLVGPPTGGLLLIFLFMRSLPYGGGSDVWSWEVVLNKLVRRLRAAYDRSSVDDFWYSWSAGAEESLFRAYRRAGGLVAGNPQMYL